MPASWVSRTGFTGMGHPQKPLRGQLPPAPGLWRVTVGQGFRQRGVPHPAACTRSIPVGQEVRAARQAAGRAAPAGQAKSSRLVTSQRGLSPEPVSHLHVVVPAQPASVEVQGGEVQDDLRLGTGWGGEESGVSPPPSNPRGSLSAVLGRAGCQRSRWHRDPLGGDARQHPGP